MFPELDSELPAFRSTFVRPLFASSNTPSRMFYNCVGAEILRIGRVCSSVGNFLSASRIVIHRAMKQGAKMPRLEKIVKKMYGRHQVLRTFHSNAKKFSDNLLHNYIL